MYSQLDLLTLNAGSELVRIICVILINILAACVIGRDLGSIVYHLSAVVQILLFLHSQSQCATLSLFDIVSNSAGRVLFDACLLHTHCLCGGEMVA